MGSRFFKRLPPEKLPSSRTGLVAYFSCHGPKICQSGLVLSVESSEAIELGRVGVVSAVPASSSTARWLSRRSYLTQPEQMHARACRQKFMGQLPSIALPILIKPLSLLTQFMNRTTARSPAHHPSATSQTDTAVASTKVHKSAAVADNQSDFILCCYQNPKASIQVIRSTSFDIPKWHLERVIFPGQRLMFYAPPQAKLKVYNGSLAESLLSDTIPCDRLQTDGDYV